MGIYGAVDSLPEGSGKGRAGACRAGEWGPPEEAQGWGAGLRGGGLDGGEDHSKEKVWVWGLGGLCVPRDTADLRPWSKARVLGPLPEEWTPGTGAELTILGSTPWGQRNPAWWPATPRDSHLYGLGEGAGLPPTPQAAF